MSALTSEQRAYLAVLGNQIATTAELTCHGHDVYQSAEFWSTLQQAYVAALYPKGHVADTRWYRTADLTVITGLGFCLGMLFSPLGAVGGSLVGALGGSTISVAKGKIADRLLKAPDPRRFATGVITPIVADFERKQGGAS